MTVSFDASGNQLRPNTPDYFTFQYDITGLVGEGAEQDYLTVTNFGGTGAFDFIGSGFPDEFPIRIYDKYFAAWGYPGFGGPSFSGDFPWTASTVSFIAVDPGRIDFSLWTVFGGYGPLIDNLSIDITPTGADATAGSTRYVLNRGAGDREIALLTSSTNFADVTVPEPASIAVLGLGAVGLFAGRRVGKPRG